VLNKLEMAVLLALSTDIKVLTDQKVKLTFVNHTEIIKPQLNHTWVLTIKCHIS